MEVRRTEYPLPSTTFVSGRSPRPLDGWFDDVDVADHFDFACDLFDAGCFFEAHEVWEQVWFAAQKQGDVNGEALAHGLIRLAAAGVKWRAGDEAPSARHREGAAVILAGRSGLGLSAAAIGAAIAALEAGRRPRLREP